MTLPATFNEALESEALAFARDWIARAREPGGPLHPAADVVASMKYFAATNAFAADEILYLAQHGCPEADAALRQMISENREWVGGVGEVLHAYNVRIIRLPPRPPETRLAANFVRDMTLVLLMVGLMDRFGLALNHNPGVKRPTASTVAAAALTDAGVVSMNHKGTEKVWRRYLPAFAGTRFAASSRRFAFGLPASTGGLFG